MFIMPDIKTIADRADIIVNGYAFEKKADGHFAESWYTDRPRG